jgi:hypothetical protein
MFLNYPDPQVKKQIGTLTQIFYQFQDEEETTNGVETIADTDNGAIYGNFSEFNSHIRKNCKIFLVTQRERRNGFKVERKTFNTKQSKRSLIWLKFKDTELHLESWKSLMESFLV